MNRPPHLCSHFGRFVNRPYCSINASPICISASGRSVNVVLKSISKVTFLLILPLNFSLKSKLKQKAKKMKLSKGMGGTHIFFVVYCRNGRWKRTFRSSNEEKIYESYPWVTYAISLLQRTCISPINPDLSIRKFHFWNSLYLDIIIFTGNLLYEKRKTQRFVMWLCWTGHLQKLHKPLFSAQYRT